MKIVRNTPSQLILENTPIFFALMISAFGLVFVAIGVFAWADALTNGIAFVLGGMVIVVVGNLAFVRRTQVILDQTRALVELRRRSWLGYSSMTWELRYLAGALVQTSNSGDTPTHRAVLNISGGMDEGVHPITLVYSSGKGAHLAEAAINDWLAALDSGPTPT
ncbi:MAG: hypothetical protein AAF307_04915 [Pseudomonadota bacterium]